MHRMVMSVWLTAAVASAFAQVPAADLARPPSSARHFIIQSTGGKHGDSWSWVAPDGTRMARESMNLRGQVFELDSSGKAGTDGMPATLAIRGVTPQGDAAETFTVSGGTAAWKSPIDAGTAAYSTPAFYVSQGGPIDTTAWFLEALLARPDKSLDLLPGGKAHAAKLVDLKVGAGATAQTIALWSVTGIGTSPLPMWADANNKFFALALGIAWLPETYAGEQKTIEEAQARATAAQAPGLAKSLVKVPAGPVAFTGVRLFDADAPRFVNDQTVVVDKGLITAVGARESVKVPAGAQVIDGRGKTLIPGLWDCHMHVGDDFTGLQELSMGVTSVRDPGNDDVRTIERRTRARAGDLLFPHVYPSSLIDGKGPYTAQVANVATSEAEAIALIDKAKANGFIGIKFYGTFNSAWLAASIREAHKLGLHVHGHIPAGIRPVDAINAGYDEITHINWVMMQAMPDSVIPVSNGIMRFEGPGRYAKDVDLEGQTIKAILGAMVSKHVYSDPTMVAFESLYVPDNGDLSPSYAPFVGTMPPTTERGFRTGGFAVPKDITRADYRASWSKMVALLGRMHEAGVPIVAGTDGAGIELVHELEIYMKAGFSAAEALAAATIVPARLVGQDAKTGSVKVGKAADLALIDGDPSTRIGDLRQTRVVMLDGRLLDADALRSAAGFSGRPK
jgi:imidazolonepropionase-like amidohydrolase